jgi:hypothetical protein
VVRLWKRLFRSVYLSRASSGPVSIRSRLFLLHRWHGGTFDLPVSVLASEYAVALSFLAFVVRAEIKGEHLD